MTITDIDKQFFEKFDSGNRDLIGKSKWDVLEFIHQIYDQAKAEQRKEDALLAEWQKFIKLEDGTLSPSMKLHNQVCDDIATTIRETK